MIKTSVLIATIAGALSVFWGTALVRGQDKGPQPKIMRFDVVWWQNANSDEQQGFIYGYLDCRQIPKAAKASIVDYQNSVSISVKSQSTRDPNAITKAIESAAKTLKSRDTRGAEVYDGPHGFLDGGWWGDQPANWGDSDRGYLEGYLECALPPVTSQAVSKYQRAIDRHYASGTHDDDKIADVLQQLLKSASLHQD